MALLRQHAGAVEADLLRFYGLSLADLGSARLTWRRLHALLQALPPESALQRAANPDSWAWTLEAWLLAALVDRVGLTNHVLAAVNTPKGKKPAIKAPTPVPRPGVGSDDQRLGASRRVSTEQVVALLRTYDPPEG